MEEQFDLEENLKDFGIKIKPQTELCDNSDYYDEDSDDELVYSYARPYRSSYSAVSTSASLPSTSAASNQRLHVEPQDSTYNTPLLNSVGGSGRKRKQELSTIERDGSFPEEMTFQEYEAELAAGRYSSIGGLHDPSFNIYSKRKDKPPLYLLNPDDFQHDPMKQYQIRRAIITYRHHQEKKELIRRLKDENTKLRMVVENFKKRENAMLKYCNCQRIMEIIISSNPEDVLQLPPPAPMPLPSIPPLPKCRITRQQFQQQLFNIGGTRQEYDVEVVQDDFEPEDMLTSFTATMIEDSEDLVYHRPAATVERRTSSNFSNSTITGKMPVGSTNASNLNGSESIYTAKSEVSNICYASASPELKRKNVGPLTISQIQRIFSMHKEKQKMREQEKKIKLTSVVDPVKTEPLNSEGNQIQRHFVLHKNKQQPQPMKQTEVTKTSPIVEIKLEPLELNGSQIQTDFSLSIEKQKIKPTKTVPVVDVKIEPLSPEKSQNQGNLSLQKAQQQMSIKEQEKQTQPVKTSPDVEVKTELIEVEGTTRRSKRTSAIFRPNAADLLKGIVRKVGTRNDIQSDTAHVSVRNTKVK